MDHNEEAANLIQKRGPGRPPNRAPVTSLDAQADPKSRETAREASRESPRLRRRVRASDDKFSIPAELIPEGMSWEFKRYLVAGQEDKQYQAELAMNYWEPVTAESNPQIGSRYGVKAGHVIIGDQMLMERPAYLTEDAYDEIRDMTISRQHSIRSSLKDAPQGHFTRDHKDVQPRIQKTYERLTDDDA